MNSSYSAAIEVTEREAIAFLRATDFFLLGYEDRPNKPREMTQDVKVLRNLLKKMNKEFDYGSIDYEHKARNQ